MKFGRKRLPNLCLQLGSHWLPNSNRLKISAMKLVNQCLTNWVHHLKKS